MSLINTLLGRVTSLESGPVKELLPWVCLAFTPGVGPKTFQTLMAHGCSPKDIYDLPAGEFSQLPLAPKSIEHIKKYPLSSPPKDVEEAFLWQQQQNNHHILHFEHPDYPDRLRHIGSPPPILMVKGNVPVLNEPQLAIVGTRHPTATGKQHAQEFAAALADAGLVITSGLAKGVDGEAHQGTLNVDGATVAVLGTGLGHVYPKQHIHLAEAICEKGALISEFSLTTKPFQGNFPRRNRIVSGLSLGTLVVEATLKSGSLITARQALEQNREVFAIPGAIANPQKAGCHHLIRQGALLVESPDQVLKELQHQLAAPTVDSASSNSGDQLSKNNKPISDDPDEQTLLKALDYDGASVDELVSRSGFNVSQLTPLLMMMELKGWVGLEDGEYRLL